jgi:hypothetical protein
MGLWGHMTEIRINNPIASGFSMVPDILWRWPGLSFKAKGFMAYLLSFRHGVCPPVAAMEAETGLGRDARKAVMRELERVGLASWVVQRDGRGRVVAKFLEVTTVPLLAAIVSAAQPVSVHTPENPSHGESVHTTEKPSDGKSVAARRVTRRVAPAVQAILKRNNKEKEAGASFVAVGAFSAALPLPFEGQAGQPPASAGGGGSDRAIVAASLGLPYLHPLTGEWVRPALQSAGEGVIFHG